MTAKHTPGPWIVYTFTDYKGSPCAEVRDSHKGCNAPIEIIYSWRVHGDSYITEANLYAENMNRCYQNNLKLARGEQMTRPWNDVQGMLSAVDVQRSMRAAPELLMACEHAMEYFAAQSEEDWPSCVDSLRSAIAKARGDDAEESA